jgi:DNA-directed RNA polymerase subunit E'/Rpb7
MFFLVQRSESVALSPKFFGKNLAADVEEALRTKVEGKCTGRWGFTSQSEREDDTQEGERGQARRVWLWSLARSSRR